MGVVVSLGLQPGDRCELTHDTCIVIGRLPGGVIAMLISSWEDCYGRIHDPRSSFQNIAASALLGDRPHPRGT